MPDSKLVLPYEKSEGNIYGETVLAKKEGDYYRIKSIPFYASKIALYDLIEAKRLADTLFFQRMIESSGRNVIQITLFKGRQIKAIRKDLDEYGCTLRCGNNRHLIAFDVPKHVPYWPV